MEASVELAPVRRINPGHLSRASAGNEAGEVEVRLSRYGNWIVHVRRVGEEDWRIACSGDLAGGSLAPRPEGSDLDEFTYGSLVIHRGRRRVFVAGEEVRLTAKEFEVLLMLSTDPHSVFTKAELLMTIWGFLPDRTRVLDVHVGKLRRKLAAAGGTNLILNTWGVGYRLGNRVPVNPAPTAACGPEVGDHAPAA